MLTDAAVKKAEVRDRPYKKADSGGLFLLVTPSGGKLWRMKFEFGGKEKLLTFGPYPDVSLAKARDKRDEARASIRNHVDPSGARRRALEAAEAAKAEEARQLTFEQAARVWWEQQRGRWAPVHASDVITSLERDVFPAIGGKAITAIDAPMVLKALRVVENRGSIETARRLRQRISGVFGYFKSEGVVKDDPAAGIEKALKPLPKAGRQPAITDPVEAQKVLIAAEGSGASPITKLASRLLALTQSRPGMVRGVTWDEIEGIDWADATSDSPDAIWRVPASRMKLVLHLKDEEEFDHLIPLSRQAVDALRAVNRLTARNKLVFPSQRHSHQPLSENAIGYLYNRVGFHGRHVPHGWRAAFSTTMNALAVKHSRVGDDAVIELMLAHVPENKVKAAYDRAGHMERRRELSQEWADLLMDGMIRANDLIGEPRR